jgi:hypothetical protein
MEPFWLWVSVNRCAMSSARQLCAFAVVHLPWIIAMPGCSHHFLRVRLVQPARVDDPAINTPEFSGT